MTVFCLFDTFDSSTDDVEDFYEELVGVVDSKIAAMAFVGEQFNDPNKRLTRRFEEMDVTERFSGWS